MNKDATVTGQQTFLEIKDATFYNGTSLLFENISWKINYAEHWAIAGPVGCGKTSLLEVILGKHILRQGEIHYPFLEKYQQQPNTSVSIRDVAAALFFQENTSAFNYADFYYQQRFNAAHAEGIITAGQFLQQAAFQPPDKQLEKVIQLLGIESLLPMELIKLSNGQNRKLRIARALLNNPALLLLDNPFIGLDANARQELHQLINNLIEHGTKIIITTHEAEIPEKITHVLLLDHFKAQGIFSKEAFVQTSGSIQHGGNAREKTVSFIKAKPVPDFSVAIRFNHVQVQYDEKKVLQNINWTVQKGEKWAVLGPNGSGKSTLLSLINADHPQAYANDIILFDRKRGTGESIWDIKKRIGFISPELHLYFRKNSTCREVAATGLFDTLVLNRKLTEEQEDLVARLFDFYNFGHLLHKSFLKISSGQQRVVLLIRSLIKNPELIIWDEPFQGLDARLIAYSTSLLQHYCTSNNTLLFVSHYAHEIPAFVTKFLFLEHGKATISHR